MKGVAPLIKDISFDARLADKAFDAGWLLQDLNARGARAVIPPKANRTVQRDYDTEVYKWRHLVENYFAKIKEFRGIATRYDKTESSYAASWHLAAALIQSLRRRPGARHLRQRELSAIGSSPLATDARTAVDRVGRGKDRQVNMRLLAMHCPASACKACCREGQTPTYSSRPSAIPLRTGRRDRSRRTCKTPDITLKACLWHDVYGNSCRAFLISQH